MFKTFATIFILFTFTNNLCFSQQDYNYEEIKKCVELKNKGEYKKAYKCFKKHRNNMYAIYYSAVICKQLNQRKKFTKLSEKLISKEFDSPKSYSLYCRLFVDDTVKYFKTINKGLRLYPGDISLLTEKSNYYIKTNNFKKLLPVLDLLLLKKNYRDKNLYLIKGTAYQNIKLPDSALNAYNKSLEIDSTQSDVYYNIASIYYNKAVEIYNTAYNISHKENEKYEAEIDKAIKILKESLPYFLKANKYKPNDINILQALKIIYNRLKMNKESKEIEEKIKNIENK